MHYNHMRQIITSVWFLGLFVIIHAVSVTAQSPEVQYATPQKPDPVARVKPIYTVPDAVTPGEDDDRAAAVEAKEGAVAEEQALTEEGAVAEEEKTDASSDNPAAEAPQKEAHAAVETTDLEPAIDLNSVKGCQSAINALIKDEPLEFLPGRYSLSAAGTKAVKDLAVVIKDCQSAKLIIEGHTDDVGNPIANQRLSGFRANSVMQLFEKYGVNKKRMRAVGYGADKPLVPNDSDENMATNRRIELRLY